jgi:hypothetical protein
VLTCLRQSFLHFLMSLIRFVQRLVNFLASLLQCLMDLDSRLSHGPLDLMPGFRRGPLRVAMCLIKGSSR